MTDQIHVAGIPHAWGVLRKMQEMAEFQGYHFPGIAHWMDAKDLSWAVACMKHMDDDPAVFTGGAGAVGG